MRGAQGESEKSDLSDLSDLSDRGHGDECGRWVLGTRNTGRRGARRLERPKADSRPYASGCYPPAGCYLDGVLPGARSISQTPPRIRQAEKMKTALIFSCSVITDMQTVRKAER